MDETRAAGRVGAEGLAEHGGPGGPNGSGGLGGPDGPARGSTVGELVLDGAALVAVALAAVLPAGTAAQGWGDGRVRLVALLVVVALALPHLGRVVRSGARDPGITAAVIGVVRTALVAGALVPLVRLGDRVTVGAPGQAFDALSTGRADASTAISPWAAAVWGLLLAALALTLLPRSGERRPGASGWWRDLAVLCLGLAVVAPPLQVLLPDLADRWRSVDGTTARVVPWSRAWLAFGDDGVVLLLLLVLLVLRRPGAAAAYAVLGACVPLTTLVVGAAPRTGRLTALPPLTDTLTPTLVVLGATGVVAAALCLDDHDDPTGARAADGRRDRFAAAVTTARVSALLVLVADLVGTAVVVHAAGAGPGPRGTQSTLVSLAAALGPVVLVALVLLVLREPDGGLPARGRQLAAASLMALLGAAALAAFVVGARATNQVVESQATGLGAGGLTTWSLIHVARQAGLGLVAAALLVRGRGPVLDLPAAREQNRDEGGPQALRSISATR